MEGCFLFNLHKKEKPNNFLEVIQQVVELIVNNSENFCLLKSTIMVWKSVFLKKLPIDDLDPYEMVAFSHQSGSSME